MTRCPHLHISLFDTFSSLSISASLSLTSFFSLFSMSLRTLCVVACKLCNISIKNSQIAFCCSIAVPGSRALVFNELFTHPSCALFLSQWILKESKRKDLLVGHKESMFLAKWVQYCADPKVVLVRPSSIKLLPCWPLYCQLKHQHRTQTNKTQKHETQVERSYVLSRGASTRSLVDTSSSCADLAGDVLHLVLGLLQLAPHPRHLAHQPPVVSLRLLPQLDSITI